MPGPPGPMALGGRARCRNFEAVATSMKAQVTATTSLCSHVPGDVAGLSDGLSDGSPSLSPSLSPERRNTLSPERRSECSAEAECPSTPRSAYSAESVLRWWQATDAKRHAQLSVAFGRVRAHAVASRLEPMLEPTREARDAPAGSPRPTRDGSKAGGALAVNATPATTGTGTGAVRRRHQENVVTRILAGLPVSPPASRGSHSLSGS